MVTFSKDTISIKITKRKIDKNLTVEDFDVKKNGQQLIGANMKSIALREARKHAQRIADKQNKKVKIFIPRKKGKIPLPRQTIVVSPKKRR